jgi:hypothetical protein|tara:strand:- start:228 stop:1022 length:795 start_codon:yes stop_codon:yes gene_type:complete
MKKIRHNLFALIELILHFKWRVSVFLLMLPIIILIVFFTLLEMRQSNLFFMIIFLLNYYIAVFILILIFIKAVSAKLARSPFHFIQGLNYSSDKAYKDKYKTQTGHKPLIGAEIGVAKGNHAKQILSFLNIKQLVLVDPWVIHTDWINRTEDETYYENRYKETLNKFSNNNKVKIIRDYSVNAAKMFDDKYFDFVYLDGDHSYEAVKKDLDSWYPKLKKYGVMCGDDYGKPGGKGIIKAVSEFTFMHKLVVTYGTDRQFWFVKI